MSALRIARESRWEARVAIAGLALLVLSCATTDEPPADASGADETSASSWAPAPPPPPPPPPGPPPPSAIVESLVPPLRPPPRLDYATAEARFDVTVNEAPAREFFMSLVDDTPYDISLDGAVNGAISLALHDVTVEEVLETVREVYGYDYKKTAWGFVVLPSGLRSQVFHVNYVNLQRKGRSQTRVSSGQVSQTQGRQSGMVASGLVESQGSHSGETTSGSQIRTDSSADLWEELAENVRAIIGDGDGRSVVASPNTGLIVVRALAAELDEVAAFLDAAEKNLSRQVIIEAKILEVQLNDGFQAGVNWAQLIQNGNTSVLALQTGGGRVFEDGNSEQSGKTGALDPQIAEGLEVLSSGAVSAFGGVFGVLVKTSKFAAFVELLEMQGKVKILSNPRISTLNNQKAVIKVGQDEFFVTDVSTTTVSGVSSVSTPSITLTPFFSGIALDVTPQISGDDSVILHVHPSVSDVQDQTKVITLGDDQEQRLPLALSTIRESDSVVRARSGEMVVIGGLMQETATDDRAMTPIIGKIPYLGFFFRQTRAIGKKSELVILLRPMIVEHGASEESIQRIGEGFLKLDPEWSEGIPTVIQEGGFTDSRGSVWK